MKKITLNEELTRIQEMMGVTHTSPSGKVTNMSPEDDDYEINYGKDAIKELSPSDIVNSMREEEMGENDEVKDKFKDQYGKEKGEKVYYATANKQDRDPETFEKNEESAIGGWDLAMEEGQQEESWMQMRAGKDGKVYENEEMGEARKLQQETYFETQAGALQSAEEYATYKGYTVNWESINPEHVAYGQTVSYSVELMKDGMPARKMLQISLYRMESGKYELTNYIN
jgi:hypothetical protein